MPHFLNPFFIVAGAIVSSNVVKLLLLMTEYFPVTERGFKPSVILERLVFNGRNIPTSSGCSMLVVCGGNNNISILLQSVT